ncbi:hypothetical protein [Ascidiimonas aurantiaca]|uniref:hypothetical protein n=1 Tax=Ascidiimonas aurantiaca TaxID=1685432 RepID=UPI0030EE0A86
MKKVNAKLKGLTFKKLTIAGFQTDKIKGGTATSNIFTICCPSHSVCPRDVQCY